MHLVLCCSVSALGFLHAKEARITPHRSSNTALTPNGLHSTSQDQFLSCLEEATGTDHSERHTAPDFLELVWGSYLWTAEFSCY